MEDPLALNTAFAEDFHEKDPLDEVESKSIKMEESEQSADEQEFILNGENIEDLSIKLEEDPLATQEEVVIKTEPPLTDDDVALGEYTDLTIVKEEYDTSYDLDPVVRKCRVVVPNLIEGDIKERSRRSRKEKPFKPFICHHCKYRCPTKSSLRIHINRHTDKKLKPYKCDQCKYRCSSQAGLVVHIRSHTGEKPYACDQCDYRCGIRTHLANHKRIHTGERPFECKFCGYRAYQLGNLLEHERIHTKIKPFKCEYCDYRATRKRHLVGHLNIHRGKKPLKCKYCDHRASCKRSLTEHVRTHTGEKPYKCDHCDYRCNIKSALTNHNRRWHAGPLGAMPYKCDRCDYRCAKEPEMKAHLYGHTGVTPFCCNYCTFKTSYKPSLAKHIHLNHMKSSSTTEIPSKVRQNEHLYVVQEQNVKARRLRKSYLKTNGGLFSCSDCLFTSPSQQLLNEHLTSCHHDLRLKAAEKDSKNDESDEEYTIETEPETPVVRNLRSRATIKKPWWRFSDFIMSESDGDDEITEPSVAPSNGDD